MSPYKDRKNNIVEERTSRVNQNDSYNKYVYNSIHNVKR